MEHSNAPRQYSASQGSVSDPWTYQHAVQYPYAAHVPTETQHVPLFVPLGPNNRFFHVQAAVPRVGPAKDPDDTAIMVSLATGETISALQASKRPHVVGFPRITEPLPEGIDNGEVIRSFPNHLWGPLLIQISETWRPKEIEAANTADLKANTIIKRLTGARKAAGVYKKRETKASKQTGTEPDASKQTGKKRKRAPEGDQDAAEAGQDTASAKRKRTAANHGEGKKKKQNKAQGEEKTKKKDKARNIPNFQEPYRKRQGEKKETVKTDRNLEPESEASRAFRLHQEGIEEECRKHFPAFYTEPSMSHRKNNKKHAEMVDLVMYARELKEQGGESLVAHCHSLTILD